jgi:hypothetical protein
MMSDYIKTDSVHLSDLADKLRELTGETKEFTITEMIETIPGLSAGGKPAFWVETINGIKTVVHDSPFVVIHNKQIYTTCCTENVKIIPPFVFYGESLYTAIKPYSLPTAQKQYFLPAIEEIKRSAFQGNSGLLTIEFPSTLKALRTYAFSGCSKVTHIFIPKSVEVIETQAFYGVKSSCKIYVESGAAPSGWASNWNRYNLSNTLTVNYGVSRDEFKSIIGG